MNIACLIERKIITTLYEKISFNMAAFLDQNFLLNTKTAQYLYHEHASSMPIIDYHNHLPPDEIAGNKTFGNLTEIWLKGDHYKWRAMRANGINEKFITGNAPDRDKFIKWAETVPYTMRNPLYHWTHLELQRYFEINDLLSPKSGEMIYQRANELLQANEFSTQNLLKKMNVEVVCTTDDPADNLEFHQKLNKEDCGLKMLPGFRPDKYILIQQEDYPDKIKLLEQASGRNITCFDDLLDALKQRISFFHEFGCRLSDHGLSKLYASDFTHKEVDSVFKKCLSGKQLENPEAIHFQSAILYELGKMYYDFGWTMQFHLGALRNNNRRLMNQLGADVGCDSIGDFEQAIDLSRYLNRLDVEGKLCKTILYNLNPRDNELFATMAGNYNDGSIPGKIQWGSAWWFLDQKDGMEAQINVLSNMGLLSRFIGMLTDSRSFLSFPRHEYFRRILCDLIGKDVENGTLPKDLPWLGQMVENICYFNAKNYFQFH